MFMDCHVVHLLLYSVSGKACEMVDGMASDVYIPNGWIQITGGSYEAGSEDNLRGTAEPSLMITGTTVTIKVKLVADLNDDVAVEKISIPQSENVGSVKIEVKSSSVTEFVDPEVSIAIPVYFVFLL